SGFLNFHGHQRLLHRIRRDALNVSARRRSTWCHLRGERGIASSGDVTEEWETVREKTYGAGMAGRGKVMIYEGMDSVDPTGGPDGMAVPWNDDHRAAENSRYDGQWDVKDITTVRIEVSRHLW
ncbi:hypothetical protein Taro_013275, partial [Colocasia esculenta]|nr:hypothetical protein [Colocasia esculenta]